MESLASRLDGIRLRVQAPGAEVYAELRDRQRITLSFGESVYEWMRESTLERLLANMARLLYAEWVRKYRAELSEPFLRAMGADSQEDRDFAAARSTMECSGRSADGRISLVSRGIGVVEVRIEPGTLRELNEHEFAARAGEAASALLEDYRERMSELKLRYFG